MLLHYRLHVLYVASLRSLRLKALVGLLPPGHLGRVDHSLCDCDIVQTEIDRTKIKLEGNITESRERMGVNSGTSCGACWLYCHEGDERLETSKWQPLATLSHFQQLYRRSGAELRGALCTLSH
jgi:Pyruvate/2-oxoacid:ferredoxin oxidoreductase delta subunit